MGPAFRLPFEALSAIEAQFGRAQMLDHALQTSDEVTALVALVIAGDWHLSINLITDLVHAEMAGNCSRVRRISRRLTKEDQPLAHLKIGIGAPIGNKISPALQAALASSAIPCCPMLAGMPVASDFPLSRRGG